jgi:hypothetical protein
LNRNEAQADAAARNELDQEIEVAVRPELAASC